MNVTLAELSLLCPALLSLLRPSTPPSIQFNVSTTTLIDLEEQLKRPECDRIFASFVEADGDGVGDRNARPAPPPPSIMIVTSTTATAQTMPSALEQEDGFKFPPLLALIIMTTLFVFFSLLGIVGNVLVVVVVARVPGMITPTNCYLVSLAISDCMFFLATAPSELSYLHIDPDTYPFGGVGCALLSYIPYLAINTSSMSITAFTVERFIGICYPLRARYICTVRRAKVIILFIWVFGIIYNSPWLYLATLMVHEDGATTCDFKLKREHWAYKTIYVGDFVAFYMIPMVLYIFIYGKITYTLSRCGLKASDTLILQPANGERSLRQNSTFTGAPREFFVNSGGGTRKNSAKGKIQVIKMLAVVVFIFAVCWLPYRAMVLYNSFANTTQLWNPEWYIFLSKTMIFFNCAINPVLYNLMSGRFRNAFKRLFSGVNGGGGDEKWPGNGRSQQCQGGGGGGGGTMRRGEKAAQNGLAHHGTVLTSFASTTAAEAGEETHPLVNQMPI